MNSINIDELLSSFKENEIVEIQTPNPSCETMMKELIVSQSHDSMRSVITKAVKSRIVVNKCVYDKDCVVVYDCELNKYYCVVPLSKQFDLISNLDSECWFSFSDYKNKFKSCTIPHCCLAFSGLYVWVPLGDVPTSNTSINFSYDGYLLSNDIRQLLINSVIKNSTFSFRDGFYYN